MIHSTHNQSIQYKSLRILIVCIPLFLALVMALYQINSAQTLAATTYNTNTVLYVMLFVGGYVTAIALGLLIDYWGQLAQE